MGINYSESNMLGSGLKELSDGGLTDFGYDCVVRMNKLGILIDTAHVSPQTALNTITLSKKPVTISHSGSRTITPTTRMIPDEVIKALAEKRGVIGVEAAPRLTVTEKHPLHGIDSYMEHIEYIINLVGIDYVGCGPDTGYYDHVGNYLWSLQTGAKKGLGHYQRPDRKTLKPQHLGIDMDVEALKRLRYVRGMENPTDSIQNVARWMVKYGYSDIDIAKVIGGNALRLLKEAW
jgi:membrane dipeptidase